MTETIHQGSPQAIEKPNEPTLDAILALSDDDRLGRRRTL